MLTIRKSNDRGLADHGWLKSFHSFSFAGYHDPAHMGFGNLRVINEDRIAPGTGFGTHGHRDMEIISYVLSGNLAHKDTLGNVKGIPPGDVQIWIEPNVTGIPASYEQKTFAEAEKRGQLRLVASSDGAEGSVTLHADAALRAGLFDGAEAAQLSLDPARKTYVHLVRGGLQVNGHALVAGDAAMLQNESALTLAHGQDAEVLVFDLAP